MPAKLHPLASGSLWVSGAVLGSQAAQLVYSVVTARLLSPAAFGAYATALAAMGLVAIIAANGLDLAVARTSSEPEQLRSVVSAALLIGLFAAAVVVALADLWARIWGDPSAGPLLRLLAIAVAVIPFNAVAAGAARRAGRFRQLSIAQAGAALLGVVLGLACVYATRAVWSLPISVVVATVSAALLGPHAAGGGLGPGRLRRDTTTYLGFGSRALTSNLIEYAGWAGVQWATSRAAGPVPLGQLNRALAFASMPILALNTAVSNVLAPSYGSDSQESVRRSQLGRSAILSTWLGLGSAAVVAGAAYPLIPVLLGPGWDVAAGLSILMALASGGSVAAAPMSVYLQSQDRFREYRRIQYATLGVYVGCAVVVLTTHAVVWAALAYTSAAWLRYVLLLVLLTRCGDLRVRLGGEVGLALLGSLSTGVVVASLLLTMTGHHVGLVVPLVAVAGLLIVVPVTRSRSAMPTLVRGVLRLN